MGSFSSPCLGKMHGEEIIIIEPLDFDAIYINLIIEFLGPKFGAILEVEVPQLDTGVRDFAILLYLDALLGMHHL